MLTVLSPDQDAEQKSRPDQQLLGLQKELEKQRVELSVAQLELSSQREQVNALGFPPITVYSFRR